MRKIQVFIMCLCLTALTFPGVVFAKCFPGEVISNGPSAGGRKFDVLNSSDVGYGFVYTTTVLPTSGTTYSFANSSGTSGCGKNTAWQVTPEQFAAQTGTPLMTDAAHGQGQYLHAMAALLGCRGEAIPAFGRQVQARFTVFFPEEDMQAGQWVGMARRMIVAEPALATGCHESG